MKKLRPREVFASLARGDTTREWWNRSRILESKNLTALTLWERKQTLSFHLSLMPIHSFSHRMVFFLPFWFLHRWTVSELNNSWALYSKFWEETREWLFLKSSLNSMSDPEGKIGVSGLSPSQVTSGLESSGLDLELNIMYISVSSPYTFSL